MKFETISLSREKKRLRSGRESEKEEKKFPMHFSCAPYCPSWPITARVALTGMGGWRPTHQNSMFSIVL